MVPSRPGCAPPPPAARSSSRPTASCRATSSCTRTCCVTDLLRLVRINNLLLAAAGVLAGGWIALGAVRTPNVLALAAVAAVGVAMAGNVLNDIWDQAADRVNRSGGERPLATGRVTRGTADLCVASGAVIGVGAAAFVNGTAVLVGLAAFAVLGLYSPVLKRRGLPGAVPGSRRWGGGPWRAGCSPGVRGETVASSKEPGSWVSWAWWPGGSHDALAGNYPGTGAGAHGVSPGVELGTSEGARSGDGRAHPGRLRRGDAPRRDPGLRVGHVRAATVGDRAGRPGAAAGGAGVGGAPCARHRSSGWCLRGGAAGSSGG